MNDGDRLSFRSNAAALAGVLAIPVYGILALAFALWAVFAPSLGLLVAMWAGPFWWWLAWGFASLCISIRNVVALVRMMNDTSRQEALLVIGWTAAMIVSCPAWYVRLIFP